MQASDWRALRPVYAVRHAYVERHFSARVLPDVARWTTTHAAIVHAADRHARTGGLGAQKAAGADPTLMF